MMKKWLRVVPPILGLAVFAVALVVLDRALHHYRLRDIVGQLHAIPGGWVAAAAVLTLLDYFVLTLFDTIGLRYAGSRLAYRRTALASFVGYAFSHNIGFSFLTGVSVRYRLYGGWGLSTLDVARVIAANAMTFWIGYAAVAGVVFVAVPPQLPAALHLSVTSLRPVGVLLLFLVAGVVAASASGRRAVRVRDWTFELPKPRLLGLQVLVSTADWCLAAGVLFVLLPPATGFSYVELLGIFLVAQFAGLASNIPGGLGVFESLVLVFVPAGAAVPAVIGALLVYRATYYIGPLVASALLLGAHEVYVRRTHVERIARAVGRWAPAIFPQVLGFTAFIAGTILLLSGATPANSFRIALLREFVPLPLVEASHFLGSVVGAGLVLIGRGLQRRLDAAWLLAVALLAFGIVFSLLKGLDYEEAIILALVLAALAPNRRHFYRRASLVSEPFSAGWIAAVVLVLGGSVWLGFFSFKHVEFSSDLWWRFAFRADAPRFLRAMVGATVLAAVFGLVRLLAPARPRPGAARPDDVERAREIVVRSPRTSSWLALLGDKSFLFNDAGTAFVMYAVRGRSWVALGDPVGPPIEHPELAWHFRELCDRHNGWPVFYQVGPASLPIYLDLGLNLLKIGEEARVPLTDFSLEGHARKWLRYVVRRAATEGLRLEIVPAEKVPELLPKLRAVSDAWLQSKNAREKHFSLGYFDEHYLALFPAAIVARGEEIVGFANIWPGGAREELSVDLMRFVPGLPPVVMDYLFTELMLWGAREGFRWFNLGVCPLAGLESRSLASPWHRVGSLVYRHGENFYNFQGLRQYKEKFEPEWTPTYLASPGGLVLPRVLTQLTTLISGGLRGVANR